MCLYSSVQEEDVFEHINVKCHLCTLESTCRPVWNIGINLIKLLNMLKNMVSGIGAHVTLIP